MTTIYTFQFHVMLIKNLSASFILQTFLQKKPVLKPRTFLFFYLARYLLCLCRIRTRSSYFILGGAYASFLGLLNLIAPPADRFCCLFLFLLPFDDRCPQKAQFIRVNIYSRFKVLLSKPLKLLSRNYVR